MSDRINQIIVKVKDMILTQNKQAQDYIHEIENQIDQKQSEIRDLFANNIDSVIEHYNKYNEILSYQKRLENACQQFSKRIQKTQKLSLYDQELIDQNKEDLQRIDQVSKQLQEYRDYIKMVKRIAMNINQEKYSNAIKIMNQLKNIELKKDTPLKKVNGILRTRISQHLVKLVTNFWQGTISKQTDVGTLCFNKVLLTQHEKQNIYQNFFNRNTRRSNNNRASSIDAPMRFIKKISDQSDILQKYIVRINIQISPLKQVKILCIQLEEESLFKQLLKNQMRRVITKIKEDFSCQNHNDFRKMLCRVIGFLLVRKQVVACFDLKADQKLFMKQIYQMISVKSKEITLISNKISDILKTKQLFQTFHTVIDLLSMDKNLLYYTTKLAEMFKAFCQVSLQFYQSKIQQSIKNDNYTQYVSQQAAQQKLINQVLSLSPDVPYRFTSIIAILIEIFSQFNQSMLNFVKDSNLNKSQLHDNLAYLLQRFVIIYGAELIDCSQPLQISQGEINLRYSQQILKYFSRQIQQQYVRTAQWTYQAKLQQVLVELLRRIREIVEQKVEILMHDYHDSNFMTPNDIQSQPADFVDWLLEYINQTISCMRKVESCFDKQIAFTAMNSICQIYWDVLSQAKEWNLLAIYNLDMDLLHIYKYCARNFTAYQNITDIFKSLRQFYSFLLVNNINDITDPQKRHISFPTLQINKIIPILKRYNKSKLNGNGKVRDLRKKDLDSVIKKLQTQIK